VATPLLDIKSRIENLKQLPTMPGIARQIIALRSNLNGGVNDLAKIVETDPSLAAQVLRYARSPLYGYRGKVDSVHAAIARVLGYELVLNLALGIATAKPFKVPRNGPFGLDAFWRHALHSAALTQGLSTLVPTELRPPAGMAYLAGLLHNLGQILLGHLFKQEYLILNKFITQEPEKTLIDIELEVLGIDHGQLGAWLMKSWDLPEETITAVKEHHNENFRGPHAIYPLLVLVSDRILKKHDLGDATSTELPAGVLQYLEISEYEILAVTQRVMERGEDLTALANHMTAV
jgi:HD-like signal output (HDOD) protein